MSPSYLDLAISLGLFIALLVCLAFGFRVGQRAADEDERFHEGLGAIEAAIFALLGLLLAFDFAGAVARFDARRQLIVREASAIGTAYLRVDLLPVADQPAVRQLFRDYLQARVAAYDSRDLETTNRHIQEGAELQQRIWAEVIRSRRNDQTQDVALIVVPAVNEMIDVTTARSVALQTRLPRLILALLIGIAIITALVAGYSMAKRPRRSLLHMVLYAATVSVTVYVLLDLDNPRVGLIRLDATERILKDLHDSIR